MSTDWNVFYSNRSMLTVAFVASTSQTGFTLMMNSQKNLELCFPYGNTRWQLSIYRDTIFMLFKFVFSTATQRRGRPATSGRYGWNFNSSSLESRILHHKQKLCGFTHTYMYTCMHAHTTTYRFSCYDCAHYSVMPDQYSSILYLIKHYIASSNVNTL